MRAKSELIDTFMYIVSYGVCNTFIVNIKKEQVTNEQNKWDLFRT